MSEQSSVPTMTERVAQSMLERLMRPKRPRVSDKDGWLDLAQAAIEEMREPTPEMLASGVSALPNEGGVAASRHEADHVWQAMIDAALGQEGTEG